MSWRPTLPAALATALLLIWLPAAASEGPTSATPSTSVLDRALRDELTRSLNQLRLAGVGGPYFVAYRVDEVSSTTVSAQFGSLLGEVDSHRRYFSAEVRVGDYQLDNTNFFTFPGSAAGVGSSRGGTAQLPLDDDYRELRRQIWLTTDGAYKQAVEDLSRKQAALQNKTRTQEIPDFSHEPARTIVDEAPAPPLDVAAARTLVRQLSALFRQMPEIYTSEVRLERTEVLTRYLNSEGTTFLRRGAELSLVVEAETQAADGMPLADAVTVFGRSLDDLPTAEELAAQVRAMGQGLSELRQAERLERYNGPVLVTGQAAAELFLQLFAPHLVSSRRPVTDNPQLEPWLAQQQSPFVDRVGGRVLPRFFDLVDDPTRDHQNGTLLLGGQKVDDDGVPPQPVQLVEHGILKRLLADRTPSPRTDHSTGSRRRLGPIPSNLLLHAADTMAEPALREELLELAEERGLDYALVIERLDNPLLTPSRGELPGVTRAAQRAQGREGIGAIEAYRLYRDGHRERVRNGELTGLSPAVFKEIVGAAAETFAYTSPLVPAAGSARNGFNLFNVTRDLPLVSAVVPRMLLFDDLSLKGPDGEIPRPPVLSHPFFAQQP